MSIAPAHGEIRIAPEPQAPGGGWSKLVRPSPERRINVAMAYLPALEGVVMYGGLICPGIDCLPLDETWLWDGSVWKRLKPATSPPPLHAAAMTYDPARKELVLFGGETCSTTDCSFSSETWTFDGITWEKQAVVVPPPASAASAMGYDARSQRIILMGGCAQDRCPGLVGTWSWDGATWKLEDLLTPLPRTGAVAATNPGGGVVLFGGADARGGTFGETWIWDGGWTQRTPATSPPTRAYAGITSTPGSVVLFAGSSVTCSISCTGGYLNDTWTWDGTTWMQRPSDPAPRGGQGMAIAYDAAREEVVRFGGISTFRNFAGALTAAYESSTWVWDGTAWQERRSPMPEERIQPAMGFHPAAGVMVMTGGNCLYTTTCDTWTWDGASWTRIDARAPAPNARRSLIPDASGSLLFPLAGAVWKLSYDAEEGRWSWSELPNSAFPITHNGSVQAGDRDGNIVSFGSQDCSASCVYSDRTWRWDGSPWAEAVVDTKPPGRAFGMMTFDPVSRETILFGGLADGGTVYHQDTWTWDGAMWTQVAAPGPRARSFTRLAADPATGDAMLLGGISGPPEYTMLADQWLFDGTTWRDVTPGGPVRRIEHVMAPFPPTSTTVLFGGQDANPGRPMSDTWVWSG